MLGDMSPGEPPQALMRRALPVLFAVVAAVGLTTACGGGDSQGAGSPESTELAGGGHEGASPVAENARHVPVSARSFAFEPEEITAKIGEDIAIVLMSKDGLHDFTIDELDAHVSAEQGQTAVGGFRAERPGRYTFYCSVAGHRDAGMEGVLVVEA